MNERGTLASDLRPGMLFVTEDQYIDLIIGVESSGDTTIVHRAWMHVRLNLVFETIEYKNVTRVYINSELIT